jgi:hypothetical protein
LPLWPHTEALAGISILQKPLLQYLAQLVLSIAANVKLHSVNAAASQSPDEP